MRGQLIKQMLAEGIFAVEPRFLNSLIDVVNSNEGIDTKSVTDNEVAQSHSYEKVGGVGVITVDGATTKKNTWMNALCGNFIGYDTIARYIEQAEADDEIHTILLHLDTVGGDVAGVDTVQDLIKTSNKNTVTLYDNIGASAGIWYGTASDKVYATPMTYLGSIGVMAGYYEPREDDKKVVLVSRNAKNKNCRLVGDCKDKFQRRIDAVEKVFHSRVMDNTGLTEDEIVRYFDYGDVIPCEKALEIGFIDGIISKKELLSLLETTPPGQTVKPMQVGGNGKISTQGQSMSIEEKLETANSTIETLKVEMAEKDARIEALLAEKAETDGAIEAQRDVFAHAIGMGMEMGASKDVMLKLVKADSKASADAIMMAEVRSHGVTFNGEARGAGTGGESEPNSGWAKVVKTSKK